MATGTVQVANANESTFYEKLNSVWHKRALQIFMVIVLVHWAEHLAQAVQIYVLGWPRSLAGGVLGLWYPWLVNTEVLHYAYALIMLVGIYFLCKGFTGRSLQWWTMALVIQFWHHIEHALLISQAAFHHNLFGSPVPTSIVQLVVPRVELHLFYNTVVFIPMVIGMYYHAFPDVDEIPSKCFCAQHRSTSAHAM